MKYEKDLRKILRALYDYDIDEQAMGYKYVREIKAEIGAGYEPRVFDALLCKLEEQGYIKLELAPDDEISSIKLTHNGILEAAYMEEETPTD